MRSAGPAARPARAWVRGWRTRQADTRVFRKSECCSVKPGMVSPLEMLRAPAVTRSTSHSLPAVSRT
jgi:hypothetical protein